MMKFIRIFLLVSIIIGIGLLLTQKTWVPKLVDKIIQSENARNGVTASGKLTYINASADLITVDLPLPDAVVGKNFSVIGKARGTWFFEASFPVKVLSNDGKILASGIAKAGGAPGSWMTENFVPFKADLKVPDSFTGKAELILQKDNPSGLPAHDASLIFPITIEH